MINGGIRFREVETAQPFVCRNKKDENQSEEGEEGRKGDGKWIGAASEQSIERKRDSGGGLGGKGRGKLTESLI